MLIENEEYHLGLVLRIYPNTNQKRLIKNNSNINRYIYNELVALSKYQYHYKYMIKKFELIIDIYNHINNDNYLKKLFKKKKYSKFKKIINNFKKNKLNIILINKNILNIWIKNRINRIKSINIKLDKINNKIFNPKLITDELSWYDKNNYDTLAKFGARNSFKNALNKFFTLNDFGYPKFKKKNYNENYITYNTNSSNNKRNIRFLNYKIIKLPKLQSIRFKGIGNRKYLINKINNNEIIIKAVTIKKNNCDKYYISLHLFSDKPILEQYDKTGNKIGIDLNLDNFLADSNGDIIDNPKFFKNNKNKLKKYQQIEARRYRHFIKNNNKLNPKKRKKIINAKNYQQSRLKVAKIYNSIKNSRHEFLNTLSTKIIKNQDVIVVEELRSKNMQKNHNLASSISDVAWSTFIIMLKYKAELHGKKLVIVNPKFTTQICNNCKFRMGTYNTKKLNLSQRIWICPKCNKFHIRDVNAAKNILDKGLYQINNIGV